MSTPFVVRFRKYLLSLCEVIRGEASASSIFPNSTDNGQSKENTFLEVLRHHVPSSCNVFLGGYLFNLAGEESKQIDIIISDSQSLRFDQLNKDGSGKSFACVDGTVAVVSIKSFLNKSAMFDALQNIASIPAGTPLTSENSSPFVNFDATFESPYKVIFALDGVNEATTRSYLEEFYTANPSIPLTRRPHYIHVLGKYSWIRLVRAVRNDQGKEDQAGVFCLRNHEADLYFISSLLVSVEKLSRAFRFIFYDYTPIFQLAAPPKAM